jgi:glycosyltransferase involved in cell wall biosynthesis
VTRAHQDRRLVIVNWRDRRHGSAGGAELYCERVARELAARGRRVLLLTSRPAGAPGREEVDGFTVRRLGGRWSVYPLALLWLLRHRGTVGAVVDSQNGIPFFTPLVVRRRTPVVLLVHHVHQDLFARALGPAAAVLGRWLEGPASRRVYGRRTVVVLSPSAREQVRRRLRFAGRVMVVPCGADGPLATGPRSAVPRVVVVGRLTLYERLEVLVDAVAEVRASAGPVELHLVGDGPGRALLEERARRTGAAVTFHGRTSDARRDELLSSAWLTVSVSDGGDWALSLVEANAAGVPALARRVPGVRDAVRHGETGWLFDASAESLGAAMTRALGVLSDPVAADALASRARTWAAGFTWGRTADGVLRALAHEEGRHARGGGATGERRTANDVTVVLTVRQSALPEGWQRLRRTGDVWATDGRTVRALLAGADESDALAVVRRLRIDASDPTLSVLVARHADVLGTGGVEVVGGPAAPLPTSADPRRKDVAAR